MDRKLEEDLYLHLPESQFRAYFRTDDESSPYYGQDREGVRRTLQEERQKLGFFANELDFFWNLSVSVVEPDMDTLLRKKKEAEKTQWSQAIINEMLGRDETDVLLHAPEPIFSEEFGSERTREQAIRDILAMRNQFDAEHDSFYADAFRDHCYIDMPFDAICEDCDWDAFE